MESTHIKLQTLQDKDLIFLLENNIRGGVSSVMGNRYVKWDDNKKMLHMDVTNLYGHSMSQMLPFDEIETSHGHPDLYMHKLEGILYTPDDSVFGYFAEFDPDNLKEETKNFPFCPENKVLSEDKYNDLMKKIKPKAHTKI